MDYIPPCSDSEHKNVQETEQTDPGSAGELNTDPTDQTSVCLLSDPGAVGATERHCDQGPLEKKKRKSNNCNVFLPQPIHNGTYRLLFCISIGHSRSNITVSNMSTIHKSKIVRRSDALPPHRSKTMR